MAVSFQCMTKFTTNKKNKNKNKKRKMCKVFESLHYLFSTVFFFNLGNQKNN